MWNFPYGFIVHIFVGLNGSTAMCWAEAIVFLTVSDSSPVGCLQFEVVLWSASMKKCLHGLVGSLCLLKSARWTYIPAAGLAGPEDGAFSARPRLSQLGPRHGVCSLFMVAKVGIHLSCLWHTSENQHVQALLSVVYMRERALGQNPAPTNFQYRHVTNTCV